MKNGKIETRTEKALAVILERVDYTLGVYEAKDFVEVDGVMGGDLYKYRVYFDEHGYVRAIYEK